MAGIFVSYRRSDTADVAGRIFDRLIAHFTPTAVFKDVDSLPLGVPFRGYLAQVVKNADAVLVLIGPNWTSCCDAQGRRRLDDPNDIVRMEVETALQQERPTIPVTVTKATMPQPTDLPEAIRNLATYNGQSVRPDPDFHHDADRLIRQLAALLNTPVNCGVAIDAGPNRDLLERLLRVVQGWHSEVIDTQARVLAAASDKEVEQVLFRYLNTRNFLAQLVAIRKLLIDHAWADKLSARLDDFLGALTFRDRPDEGLMCRNPWSEKLRRNDEVSTLLQQFELNRTFQAVVDEILARLS